MTMSYPLLPLRCMLHRRVGYWTLASRRADMRANNEDGPRMGKGICAMRGSCGPATTFGADLPCPDNGDAEPVSPHSRE